MVDVLAVSGFWLCMILLIFKGAIKERILLSAPAKADQNEIAEMKRRIQALEGRAAVMSAELSELRELQDFDRKLLGKNEKQPALGQSARTITTSAASSSRPALPLK